MEWSNVCFVFRQDFTFDALPSFYQMATAFCYPSIFEGFGIPIIEAMYSNIPVITSKGGVFGETGGEAAWYVDPLNRDKLAATLSTVLESDTTQRVKRRISLCPKILHRKLYSRCAKRLQ